MSNSLKNEKSPYLKQHENNPVDWLPWNKKSLIKAKIEKKPIFLSVGYASCHWCHVMAHESFEDTNTAKIMNEKFINIKVDREERPDLDSIFQKSLGILTGAQGGWPLSMFLDENAVPFTGGTYFSPKEMQGRPSFTQVLENVAKVYSENRDKIINQVYQLKEVFKDINRKDATLKQDMLPFVEKILQYFDNENGGFNGAPKFPQFYIFDTVLYFYKKNKNIKFLNAVENLLFSVSSRGIYDHLEGGLSRYSVDEKWIIPHFEKMLYDNILFVNIINSYLTTKKSDYLKSKLIQTLKFINDEFTSENNLIGSAFDADSDGVEGKYYVWKFDELKNLFGNELDLFKKKFNISESGNFEGSNILVENTSVELNHLEIKKIKDMKNKLLNERKKRKKPFFDDKVQTDLNCYWFYTNLFSSIILKDRELYNKTINSINIINKKLEKKIFHCYSKNDEEIDVFLDDYTYYCLLLITLYELNSDTDSLEKCVKLMNITWDLFYNSETKLLQKNIIKKNDLFVNPIDINDNNIPNGNSVYLFICNKLKNITVDNNWDNKLGLLSNTINNYLSYNFSQMFSFIKVLDICEENISLTIYGKVEDVDKFNELIFGNFYEKISIIYKKSEENYFIFCRNKTCSNKLKNLEELNNHINKIYEF